MKSPEQVPSQKYTPEREERIKRIEYLLKIADADLNSPSIVGYHGDSLASLAFIIGRGKLLGRPTIEIPGHDMIGDLYFNPRYKGFPPGFNKKSLNYGVGEMTEERAIEETGQYANILSEKSMFMRLLGLNPENDEHQALALELLLLNNDKNKEDFFRGAQEWQREDLSIMKSLNIDRAKFERIKDKVKKESRSRKGVIFGLDRKIFEKYTLLRGDDDNDFFIRCPNGLDYKDICGLRALGKAEKDFLTNLKSQI